MADTDIVWPVGTTDGDPALTARPMVFRPKDFLVAIYNEADAAERAAAALHAAGFAREELRIFTSQRSLADYARYTGQPSLPRRVAGALTDDRKRSTSTTGTPATAVPPSGSTSPTTTRPTAPSAASPAPPHCTSATTAIAVDATST